MNRYKSKELKYLSSRGYLKQITHGDNLDELFFSGKKIVFYSGFDCTAKSLHVGHLVPIMVIKYLVSMGHKAIVILGTITAQIGDPSLKIEQRKILSKEIIEENYQSISKIIKRFVTSNANPPIFLKNDWLETANLVDFLRDYGSHFSVNKMINMETFNERLKNHKSLSFLEFSYSLFQAYDFAHLYEKYNCQLQIGGSDQWGNIVAGLDLCQKLHNGAEVFGATIELLLNSAGQKMGKTVEGAVWLDEKILSPFDYWQYFRNIDDSDVVKVFCLLTSLSNNVIEDAKDKLTNAKNSLDINEIKIFVATEITKICHGAEIATQCEIESRSKFNSQNDISKAKADLTLIEEEIENLELLALLKKLISKKSNSQRKTLISQGSVKLNDITVCESSFKILLDLFEIHENRKLIRISVGKKERFIVEVIM